MAKLEPAPNRFTIRELLRTQAGFAGIAAVAACIVNREPSWPNPTATGSVFVAFTLFWSAVGYFAARFFFGRFTAVLLSMAFAAIASRSFVQSKLDDSTLLALLGMGLAVSAFVAFGWLDRTAIPFVWRIQEPAAKKQPNENRSMESPAKRRAYSE